ncbi:zinc finger and BTB domain-containing protein 14-like [Pectinophora gossypiella]|nr:zinc finger and BTB domain-containing protein 14-like [Pectinophora gossypiella]XP_049885314.1 zinc finger and BTB domain-containing protein 14-like [Pectinophora gossypiella]
MAMPEQFSLRWNDFHSNLSQSFHALLEGEDLVDVTLAAGGQYVHAHKLILSICSPYFKELFKMNPCEHPIVILKDVAHQELRQLLHFMYRGEVHVRQQELSGFLHTAELLQVKGLTVGRERSESPPPVVAEEPVKPVVPKAAEGGDSQPEWVPGGEDTIATEAPPEPVAAQAKEEATRSPLKRLLKNTTHKNSYNVKKKPRPVKDSPTHAENTEYASDNEPLIDFDNDLFHSVLVVPESKESAGWNCKTGGVKCPSCHRFFANRYNLKVHIRDKHDTREGTLQCEICQKRMRNPSCLRVHMYHHRKQAAYLAQLGGQGDQMTAVHNMVGSKWRSESSHLVDYREFDNYGSAMSTPEPSKQPGAESKFPTPERATPHAAAPPDLMKQANMTGNKWRNESSPVADYREHENYDSTACPETMQPGTEGAKPVVPNPEPEPESV